MKNKILPICIGLCLLALNIFAKGSVTDTAQIKPKLKKFYVGSGMDAGIFSTATIQHTSVAYSQGTVPVTTTHNSTGTLRFSYILNIGATFNFNLNRHLGLYTGVGIKNIGYIEKVNGFTVKHRVYCLGAPIGIKIGNMEPKKTYGFFGVGADLPFNYKEKSFTDRNEKSKLNEWFSQRTPAIMPYIFAGLAINRGICFKAQYYPNNFMNPDFMKNSLQPYYGTEVHLILLSIGYAIPVSFHHDMVKKHISELEPK